MTELRIAILGSGYMGRTYAECISKFTQRSTVWLCFLIFVSIDNVQRHTDTSRQFTLS